MNDTTRRYPRSLEQAFGPHTSQTVVEPRPKMSWRIREFATVYRIYRHTHSIRYSARIAYGMAFKGLPF